MNIELTPEIVKEAIRGNRDLILIKDCQYLYTFLEKEWKNLRDVDQLFVIERMIKEKQCDFHQILPFLYKLLEDPDPYYRYSAINHICDLDGRNHRELLKRVFKDDVDEDNRERALLLLATTFAHEKDREILMLALSMYDDPKSSYGARLTAGAAMMFQLDIPWDKDGRPAWWDEEEEELDHPSLKEAVSKTREILEGDFKN
jgi:hypothetical protein